MTILRRSLTTALVLLGCILALQATYLLAQLGSVLQAGEHELRATSREARTALLYSQAVLASVRGTTETVRRSAVHQMGYYEAMGRRSAATLARMELLIAHSDARMERITQSIESASWRAEQSVAEVGQLAGSLRDDASALSTGGRELLETSANTMALLNEQLADEQLAQIGTALAQTSGNAAVASAHLAEAAGYVRDILSPARKSFWRRLLEFLIPRPAAGGASPPR